VGVPKDHGLRVVLTEFGVTADDLLGHGGEAWVYALGTTGSFESCIAAAALEISGGANTWSTG